MEAVGEITRIHLDTLAEVDRRRVFTIEIGEGFTEEQMIEIVRTAFREHRAEQEKG